MQEIAIFWFRRDLRIEDNCGLWHALTSGIKVLPLFIYDENILGELDPDDKRISFLKEILNGLDASLRQNGGGLKTLYGTPISVFRRLIEQYIIMGVWYNRDYEPDSIKRDSEVRAFLKSNGIECFAFKDQVIFEMDEVCKNDGKPYTVYTPYSAKWLAGFSPEKAKRYPSEDLCSACLKIDCEEFFTPEKLGFSCPPVEVRPPSLTGYHISKYHNTRNIPSLDGTSFLSPHLRFGTISIREVLRKTFHMNQVFAKELIWREFFMQVLHHFPHVAEKSFKPKYDRIEWINNEEHFEKWCSGNTGFPIVDAGMRELAQTGYMHNRVRMIAANFLTRYLLTDWRWGEAWFASRLLDFDLASNNGNWQWAAGSGCDATPYFRVFNPHLQQKKFDPEFKYIRKWIPEFGTPAYPQPVVDQSAATANAARLYKTGLNS